MKKVLIADDTKNIRNMLCTCLEIEGYDTIEACDGLQAFEVLTRGNVDLVFLDIKMPQISGTEVLRRARLLGIETPVIIMTAFATVKNAIECTKLGAVSYLQKPFTVEKIKALLAELERDNKIDYKNPAEIMSEIEQNIVDNKYEDAILMLKKIISTETTNPRVYFLLSKAYEGIGDNENAQKFFYTFKMFT